VPEPITITISHRLGRAEARRRLDNGLGHIRAQVTPLVNTLEYSWTGDRLTFSLSAMRQAITGRIDVEDDIVRVELGLPLLLRSLADMIIKRIRNEGAHLLGKPPAA
jgi:Putative polyhydroxyalkanoic acid system protein (PHA_gran_rgn)